MAIHLLRITILAIAWDYVVRARAPEWDVSLGVGGNPAEERNKGTTNAKTGMAGVGDMVLSGESSKEVETYTQDLTAKFKTDFEKHQKKYQQPSLSQAKKDFKQDHKEYQQPSLSEEISAYTRNAGVSHVGRMAGPDVVKISPKEMKKDAHQMTTDFQLARIKRLEGHPKAAARYSALGQSLQKTVWAPNLAAHQGGTPPPTPIVPTPCSALDPGCFFGMAMPGSTPPPAPTDSELKIAALGLGVKGPALVAECKSNKQWDRAMEVLEGYQLGGHKASEKDTQFIIRGCTDLSGKSWANSDAGVHFESMGEVMTIPSVQP
jgi:hypothetical protein